MSPTTPSSAGTGAGHPFTLPVVPHAEPGSHLKSYPETCPKGGEQPSRNEAGPISHMELGPALTAAQIDPTGTYALRDLSKRVISVDGSGSGTWDWAFVGPYDSYPRDVMPLSFSADPTSGKANLTAQNNNLNWPLHANGKSTNWEWTFWASSGYGSGYPVLSLSATPGQTLPDGGQAYKLSYVNGNTTMYLAADSGSWNWLYVSGSNSSSQFSFHKFFVIKSKVELLFKATWPGSDFIYSAFNTGDVYYQALSDAQAGSIYQDSGLRNYQWRAEVFDCDDFSYVYKAQASRNAYAGNAEYGYAVGVIFGRTSTGAHAVNVFIDPQGKVRILEPQNGTIVDGSAWKDSAGEAYKPYFVLM
ncbi:lectin MOA-related protein [Roseateles asaccharophilus]|uniref:Agglutinin C-terminal domain-containing protein n=1 Tax=Roseateles asaccharophilus TaxID=582607 RepID=A0ABU2A3R2_9BURK|nr:lectin MOA-related protein [Roseateles asaccharophilus]MDR7331815.1 hypothetical protein [Roseateles asaccharophilus]